MRLPLTIDQERQLLVGGLNDPNPASLPKLKQGDDVEVFLQAVEKNTSTVVQYYRAVPLDFSVIKCAITAGPDVAPTDGTIRVGLVGGTEADVTPTFAPSISKPDLQTLLNAVPGVQAKGGLKVLTDNTATNIFRVRWNNRTETAKLEFVENLLEPPCDLRYGTVALPNGEVQLLKYRQQPLAFTDDFALPSVPPVTTGSVRVGTGAGNCIQSITVPRGVVGSIHFIFNSLSTAVLPVASLSVSTISAALNGIYTDGVTRFNVTQASSTVFYVAFSGPFALTDFPVLGVEMHDQEPPQTPTAKLPLNWASLEMAIDGQREITLLLEIEITDADGGVGTPIQMPVTVVNDAIDGGMSLVGSPPWQTPGDPTYVPPGSDEPVITAPGAYITPVGSGTAVGTSGRDFVITHNLGTRNVLVGVRETGGTHLRIPDDQYTCVILNDSQVEVIFAAAPTQDQYYVVIAAVIPATMALPHHHHPVSDIDGLQAIIDVLTAGGNPLDLWPNLPESKLPSHIGWRNPDGSFRFDTLPVELLPPGTPFIGPDGGWYVTLPGPPPITVQILDSTGHVPVGSLPLDPSGWPGLIVAIAAALQSGAAIPLGLVPITIPALTGVLLPPLATLRPGSAAVLPSLPRALPAFVDGGNVSGALPLPGNAGAGRVSAVVRGASTVAVRSRSPQFFEAGAKVACDGRQYYAVSVVGADAYPLEMECELFTLHVSPRMLEKNCRFAASALLTVALSGPAAASTRAQYILKVQFGHTNGSLLSSVTWDSSPISETIIVGDAPVTHAFGVAVVSDKTTGALSASASFYGRDTVVSGPPTSSFVVRACLTQFDLEDVPAVQGQISLSMKGTASVMDLSRL